MAKDSSGNARYVWLAAGGALVFLLALTIYFVNRDDSDAASTNLAAQTSAEADDALSSAGMNDKDREAIEAVLRDYLIKHPEIVRSSLEELSRRDVAQRIDSVRDNVESAYKGAYLGNPKGKQTLVMFSDYACGFCRKSVEDVSRLVADNKDLKVVIRELPILSEQSSVAARWGLAVAQQGSDKYAKFHQALFEEGALDEAAFRSAAMKAGVDLAKAKAALKDASIDQELAENGRMAQQLGLSGTPAWIVGDQFIDGAQGYDTLNEAIENARKG